MQFLEQGKIDLMIATMTDKPGRRKVVSIVDPNYYSSGTNILTPKKFGYKTWEDLRGKPVCGIQGAFYNKATSANYGTKIVAFKGTSEAYAALRLEQASEWIFFYGWFRHLYDTTGINLPFIYDAYDRNRMIDGFWMTIKLSITYLFFSTIIGMVGAWLRGLPLKWTRRFVNGYIQVF